MKTLFVSLFALLFAFFIGCQESLITDTTVPEHTKFLGTPDENATASHDILGKDALSYYPGVIKLEGMIYDPSHRLNSFAEISGVVKYKLEKVYFDSKPPAPQEAINVKLYIRAELKGGCTNHPWAVNSSTQDMVVISNINQSVYFLEKSIRVKNTCCAPLNLFMKFQVNEKVITLVSMELKKVPGWLPIPDPEM